MAAKEYQFTPITLRDAAAVRVARLEVDFRAESFKLFIDIYGSDNSFAETRVIELSNTRLDQFMAFVVAGSISQDSFEQAWLEGAVLFDTQIPNNGTVVDV